MNIARVEGRLVVASEVVGVAAYDFDFDLSFRCEHPFRFDSEELCVLRVGAIPDYVDEYNSKLEIGLRPVNSPEEHLRASELEHWYPVISDLTPMSKVFDELPSPEEVEADFGWPVFIKGSRQTSRHSASLSVARSAADYERVRALYRTDQILHWQKPVVRQFVPLLRTTGEVPGQVCPSVEFRTFWWNGVCVGAGQYWYQLPKYEASDMAHGLEMAAEAVRRLRVPFIVVDIAKTDDGGWTVIECNDAQEAGYTGISAKSVWDNILKLV